MSSEEKEAFGLVLEVLKEIRTELAEVKSTLSGLQVAVVEHTRDEEGRFDRLEQTLDGHGARLQSLETSLAGRLNGGS